MMRPNGPPALLANGRPCPLARSDSSQLSSPPKLHPYRPPELPASRHARPPSGHPRVILTLTVTQATKTTLTAV
ncbi:MAG: hypothetical protein WCP70_15515 [Methanothrix sp.]